VIEEIIKEEPLPPFEEIIERFFTFIQSILDEDGSLRVAPQVWAEALHDPVCQAIVAELFTGARSWWTELASRMRDAGRLPEDADPEAMDATIMCTMPGFVLQRMLMGNVDARTIRAGFHALAGAR
jgi:hypothetical protein